MEQINSSKTQRKHNGRAQKDFGDGKELILGSNFGLHNVTWACHEDLGGTFGGKWHDRAKMWSRHKKGPLGRTDLEEKGGTEKEKMRHTITLGLLDMD